jgi:hypothetical protein
MICSGNFMVNELESNLDLELMGYLSSNNLTVTGYSIYSTIWRHPGINGINVHKQLKL